MKNRQVRKIQFIFKFKRFLFRLFHIRKIFVIRAWLGFASFNCSLNHFKPNPFFSFLNGRKAKRYKPEFNLIIYNANECRVLQFLHLLFTEMKIILRIMLHFEKKN